MTTEIENKVEQPTPRFTLLDLERQVSAIYGALVMKDHKGEAAPEVTIARSIAHELIAEITKIKANCDSIEMPLEGDRADERAKQLIDLEKPQFTVAGVQLWEHKKLVGVSLYGTMVKARGVRDVLNAKFAELKVDHEAKILMYPVF